MKKILILLFLTVCICIGCSSREPEEGADNSKQEAAGSDIYQITYDLGDMADLCFVTPSSAKAGEQVELKFSVLNDAGIHVYVDGEELELSHYDSDYWGYAFTMPKADVKITAKPSTKEEIYGIESAADEALEQFVSGLIKAGYKDSTDGFYINDLNVNSDDWDGYSIGDKLDLDNDGDNELIINGPYGGKYLDYQNGQVIVFAEGAGAASELSWIFYQGAYWIIESDTTHAGRQIYSFVRYSGADCIADSFDLKAEYWDKQEYDESSDFTYRGAKITMEEYEKLFRDIFGTE